MTNQWCRNVEYPQAGRHIDRPRFGLNICVHERNTMLLGYSPCDAGIRCLRGDRTSAGLPEAKALPPGCQASKSRNAKEKERAPSDGHASRHFESQRSWSGSEGGFPEVNFGVLPSVGEEAAFIVSPKDYVFTASVGTVKRNSVPNRTVGPARLCTQNTIGSKTAPYFRRIAPTPFILVFRTGNATRR